MVIERRRIVWLGGIIVALGLIGLLPISVPLADTFRTPAHGTVASTPIIQGIEIEQRFLATGPNIETIALQLATYQRVNTGILNVQFRVLRNGSWQTITEQHIQKTALIDNAYHAFTFSPPLAVHDGESVAIVILGEGTASQGISWWLDPTLTVPGTQLSINGLPQKGMALLSITYTPVHGPLLTMLPRFWQRITLFLNPLWQLTLVFGIVIAGAASVWLFKPVAPTFLPADEAEQSIATPQERDYNAQAAAYNNGRCQEMTTVATSIEQALAPVIAAIPAYNEARFIGSIVLQCRRYADIVIVIDDGSRDQTASIAEAAGATVLRHEQNRGKGEGLNTAFAEARRLNARCLVLIDGDGQHEASEIPTVIEPILNDEADMTVGSRFLDIQSEIPAYRKVGQHGLTIATNLTSGTRLTDSQSGFRAFSARAITALSFRGSGFSVESEMQFLMREHGLRVAEVPISVTYEEPAKRNPFSHGMAVINGIVRLVSEGRPLFFFGVPGGVLLLLGFIISLRIITIYDTTQVLAVGYALIVLLLMTIGILAIFTGIMLNALRVLRLEIQKRNHAS